MTKHLRFLFVMLLAMIWSAGWAAVGDTYTMVTNISQLSVGDVVVIGNAANKKVMGDQSDTKNKYRIALDGTYSNNVFTDTKGEFAEVTLEAADNGWYLKTNTGYLYANSSKSNTINTSPSSTAEGENAIANITISNNGDAAITFTGSNTHNSIRYNANKDQMRFSCYESTNTTMPLVQIFKKGSVVSKKDPKIAFAAESYEAKITDKDDAYHSYVNLNNPNNLSVTYASSKTDVAEVNAAGEVKVLGLGTTTISATFAGDDTYKNATVSYELTVVDPNVLITTFTSGVDKGSNGSSPTKGDVIIKNGVNISCSKTALGYDEDYRFYAGSSFTVSVSVGTITKIQFVGSGSDSKNSLANLKATGYKAADAKNGTWIGNAREVTFTADAQARATSITVYVSLPSEITLNETAPNTIEAKTGVNVTLKRPMNVGRWNTFCVPFSIDANQVTSQFGEGTQIAEYSVFRNDEIEFATVQSNAIVAGKAYLVKPTKEAATEGYTFSNVNITALKPTKETVDNGAIDFRGIYNPTDITVGLPTNTFAAGIVGNVVKKAVNGSNMKGFRAFFIIPEGAGAQSSYMLKIDGTATSINSINGADVVVNAPVYNLQGQRVDGNNLTPGIYVKSGKKFVVK